MCLSTAENLLSLGGPFGSVLCWVSAFCGLVIAFYVSVITFYVSVISGKAGSAQQNRPILSQILLSKAEKV